MSDIDFLANKTRNDDQKSGKAGDKKEKIIWSEPEGDKPVSRGTDFFPLPFLNKNKQKEIKKPAEEAKPTIDKDKIRESRQEILKLIKTNESLGLKEKKRSGQSFLAAWLERFKKKPNRKETFIDYQNVFGQEKTKRSLPIGQGLPDRQASLPGRPVEAAPLAKPAAVAEPVKRVGLANPPAPSKPGQSKKVFNPPAKEAKPRAAKPVKERRDGFFSKFFKLIKEKIMAFDLLKAKPVRVNLNEIVKQAKPQIASTPQPKPSTGKKEVIKIKEKPLKQTEPIQIDKNASKVPETNLIKGESISYFDWQTQIITLVKAILIPVFLVGLIYLGLVYYQKQSQSNIQDQAKKFDELTEKIRQEEIGLKEVTDFQARLKIVSQIFAKHIYWTNFFKFLEDNTIKDVYYAGFSGDTGGNYSLDASGLSYSNISSQVDIYKNSQKITEVKTAGGEMVKGDADSGAKVKFSLNFSILKSIFTE